MPIGVGGAMALGGAQQLLGIGLNQMGNQQQYAQQQALMQQQFMNQQALNLQGQQIAQQNWDYTNYENQVRHMEAAGLNVGLMYGMGGGGGSTMGSGSGGSASSGNAPQNTMPQIMGLMQDAALKAAQTELTEAQANKIKSETPTSGNTGDILLENMRQEGIGTMTANKIQAWMMSDPKNEAGATEYNEKYDYRVGIDETSKLNRQFEAALFKTEAEKLNLDANALLTNKKAQGYWTELLNESKKADAAGVQAAAQKLASEWSTGEFTNWKTWADMGMKAVQSATGLIKGNKEININNPTYNTTRP
jgi:hypothetical protein